MFFSYNHQNFMNFEDIITEVRIHSEFNIFTRILSIRLQMVILSMAIHTIMSSYLWKNMRQFGTSLRYEKTRLLSEGKGYHLKNWGVAINCHVAKCIYFKGLCPATKVLMWPLRITSSILSIYSAFLASLLVNLCVSLLGFCGCESLGYYISLSNVSFMS